MATEDPNEDSWLYGGPPNAADEAATEEGMDEHREEALKSDEAANEEKFLAEQNAAPIAAVGPNADEEEEDDGFKEDEDFQKNAIPADDDPFEDDEGANGENASAADGRAKRSQDEADGDGPKEEGEDEWRDDSDDNDDDINVVIGDIKSGSSYNIKQRPPLLGPGGTTVLPDKSKQAPGKFSIDEFECVGTISGVPAHEFSIDSLDEKPWRKPGADITDYFNYGFNEDTWRAYCERQKQMRLNESGVGLQGLSAGLPQSQRIMMEPRGDRMAMGGGGDRGGDRGGMMDRRDMGSGYRGAGGGGGGGHGMSDGYMRRSGPMGGRMPSGQIDVLGNSGNIVSNNQGGGGRREPTDIMMMQQQGAPIPTKENVIQVMTAERREYSRIQGSFPNDPFFEPEPNYYGYEPTQEQQWNNDQPAWTPSGIKELTSGPQMVPPPLMHGSRGTVLNHAGLRDRSERGDRSERSGGDRDRDRERDRERSERGSRTGEYADRVRVKSEDRRDRDRSERGERSSRRGELSTRETSTREPSTREPSSREASTRDRSERAERSRSRERRRRSKSRDKDRKSRDRKKSHKKEKEIKEERLSD